jgi:2,3-bisphosphoglycerate-independent phosphoglycerate mutase
MRCILLILDGLGDRAYDALGGRTPLEAARTPHLDRLAALGMTGLFHPWRPGAALPSELAHVLLFGYTLADFPGRGYLEALGAGISLEKQDVALLGRIFAVRRRRGELILQEEDPRVEEEVARSLQAAVEKFEYQGVEVTFIPTGGIRGIVKLSGEVSPAVTDSNPIYEGRPLMEVQPWEGHSADPRARRTAQALNAYVAWSHARLAAHPLNRARRRAGLAALNAVGLQRAGQWRPIMPFGEKWGLRPLAVAAGILYRGLCRFLGFTLAPATDTDDPARDLAARLTRAARARQYDLVYVHTKAPDEAAHTKDPHHKRAVIEALDEALAVALDEIVPDPDTLLVITADHATPSCGPMIHSGEPVPLLMVGKYPWRDRVRRFSEIDCAQGALGLVRGEELLPLILNFLDRGKLMGLRDSPRDQPFFPGRYRPLRLGREKGGQHD